jgi:hypothetical protein
MALYINNEKEEYISQELVKALFHYCPATGLFTRKITTGSKAKIGSIAGSMQESGYVLLEINGNRYRAHRVAWLYMYGKFPDGLLDHINRDKADNAINNLREASVQQNSQNRAVRLNSSTGYTGVSIDKRSNRYRAYITVDGRQKALGYYSTAEEAALAYNTAAKEHFGEFRNENIIHSRHTH